MLDWFRGEIIVKHIPLPGGGADFYDHNGEIEFRVVRKIKCVGSNSATIQLRSRGLDRDGFATSLQIDGNISKFLQGHNIVGSRDVNSLVFKTFSKIAAEFPDFFSEHSIRSTKKRIRVGEYFVNMIDINQLFDLKNDESVEQWLYAAERRARSRSGRSISDRGTVYLNKSSRRWGYKFYNKWREVNARGKDHRLDDEIRKSGLVDWCKGKLRAELRLHSLELKDCGITHGYHLTKRRLTRLFNDYTGRIEMTSNVALIDEKLSSLPRCLQATYHIWRTGVSVRDMQTKNTYYRHRRELLDLGIDISIPPVDPSASNVIPLIRVVEATPVATPARYKYLVAA